MKYFSQIYGVYEGDRIGDDPVATPEQIAAQAAIALEGSNKMQQIELARNEAAADAVVQYMKNHTPLECAAYVQTNVTNLATAKDILAKLAMVSCVLIKKSFED